MGNNNQWKIARIEHDTQKIKQRRKIKEYNLKTELKSSEIAKTTTKPSITEHLNLQNWIKWKPNEPDTLKIQYHFLQS